MRTLKLSARVSQLSVLALCTVFGVAAPLVAADGAPGCIGKLVVPDTLSITAINESSVTLELTSDYTYLPFDASFGIVPLNAGTEVTAKCTCEGAGSTGKCQVHGSTDGTDIQFDCKQNTCTGDCKLHIGATQNSPSGGRGHEGGEDLPGGLEMRLGAVKGSLPGNGGILARESGVAFASVLEMRRPYGDLEDFHRSADFVEALATFSQVTLGRSPIDPVALGEGTFAAPPGFVLSPINAYGYLLPFVVEREMAESRELVVITKWE